MIRKTQSSTTLKISKPTETGSQEAIGIFLSHLAEEGSDELNRQHLDSLSDSVASATFFEYRILPIHKYWKMTDSAQGVNSKENKLKLKQKLRLLFYHQGCTCPGG